MFVESACATSFQPLRAYPESTRGLPRAHFRSRRLTPNSPSAAQPAARGQHEKSDHSGRSGGHCSSHWPRVVNEAQVDERLLHEPRKEAAGILNRAGVGLIWLDSDQADFRLRLTTERPGWASQENLGFTEHGSAGVNYPAVLKLTEKLNGYAHGITPVAPYVPGFLGAAMAHEIGHLMLGANAHYPEGVMCAEWGREQFELIKLGGLNFAREQARLLQMEVRRRRHSGSAARIAKAGEMPVEELTRIWNGLTWNRGAAGVEPAACYRSEKAGSAAVE
jgi:hypothetical protein